MRQQPAFIHLKGIVLLFLLYFLGGGALHAQQTIIKDYVLFGGNGTCPRDPFQKGPLSPGCAVQLSSATNIQGGSIGSYRLVKTTGNATMNTNIYSGGTIVLANSNQVTGNISAANSAGLTSTILSVGSSANIGGNIDVNGIITIGGGTVTGKITNPIGASYSGPAPAGGLVKGPPSLPVLPAMPAITNFPAGGVTNITSTKTITPGSYNNITLTGNKTLTLSGTGVYVFNSIKNSGSCNNFVFDFKNDPTGTIKIYVHGDVEFNKVAASLKNGGSASRMYMETHGTGSTSPNGTVGWSIANGSSGPTSKWLGTVWVPYAAISIGAGTGSADLTGALWSGTQVTVQSGVKINYAPFNTCTTPNVNAGPDRSLEFGIQTILNGSSTTAGASFSWQALNGGVINSATNTADISVSAAGTYVLTITANNGCTAKDTALVTGKVNNLIGSELQSVFQNYNPSDPPSPFFVIQNDSIMIDVITIQGKYNDALNLLITPAYGLTNILSNGNSNFIITGLFAINKLPLLNTLDSLIVYCRPYYAAFNNSGIASSAGDTSVRANLVRNGYNLTGEGIKVGIISDSYNTILTATTNPITNTAAQDVGNGDLPGAGNPNGNIKPVNVLKDFPIKRSDEGRAMLQIVHDVAPNAELFFRTGFISAGDFAVGIQELQQAGCNIIVDDVTYITEPFLKDGVIANAVDAVSNTGATYFSAAGNFAGKSYENSYNPVPAPGGLTGTAHAFGGTDVFQSVNLEPGNYTIVLQWVDDIYSLGQTLNGGTKNDLDIYLTPNTDGTALVGFNRNNTNGDPIEILPITVTSSTQTNILITNNTLGINPARFKYIVFRGNIVFNEYSTGNSTLVGQANALGAIAIGAARYDKAPPFTGPLTIEFFSSIGGTFVNNTQRNKPELVAPDGVNTTVNLGIDYDNNLYSNFFGTSAAAPHAAAVAALIMEGRKTFLNQPATSPTEIRTLLQSTATDMSTPGFDFASGYGFINADSAMRKFAKPTPVIDQLIVPPTVVPGNNVFTLTVKGKYLSYNSVINFRDVPLATTIINAGELTAQIPLFIGNPAISIYTPPISSSGLDGGNSDSLYFFSLVKKNITIIADGKVKKYAQQLPTLTATVLVDGDSLQNTSLTLADLGLTNITFITQATANSNVGTYLITPSRPFNPADPTDVGLQEKYNYTFTPANLTIDKMPLKVTPVAKTVNYGDYIGPVSFTYDFDAANVPDPGGLLNVIKSYHEGFLPNNALAVIKDYAMTQADGSVLTNADLLNLSVIASFQAVKNSRKFELVNNKLVPLTDPNKFDIQYLVDISSQSLYNYTNTPASSSFINASPGISSKALLSANSLAANTGTILVNGTLVQMVNGTLVQMVNGGTLGALVPIINGSLVQIVNGTLVQFVNGVPVPIANGTLVQMVNGTLVQFVNGQLLPLANGTLVQFVNGTLVQMVNGTLVQMVNGLQVPIVNGTLVQFVNGTLVQFVNGVPTPLVNGTLVQMVNGSLVQFVNGALQPIVNGTLVQFVNGTLVQFVNGTLVQFVNGNILGSNTSNSNAAVIIDEHDVDLQTNWIGPMFGINMITGLNAGEQTLIPGVLVNENFEISYGLGKVNILPVEIIVTPDAGQNKVYGDADPIFTFTNNAGLAATDFTGKLGRIAGEKVNTYNYTPGNLSAGPGYTIRLFETEPIPAFSITPAALTVKAIDKVIYQGSPLPIFTATITGLKNGDNPTVSFTLSPSYSGAAGGYIISPLLRNFLNAENYIITYVNGTLYVNPKGPGAKKLRSQLDCVVEVTNPLPGKFKYIARFVCINDNATTLYVPIGPDNKLSSLGGSFDGSNQPLIFKAGNTKFEVPFDGNKLTWELKTYESTHKTSVASDASNGSNKCSNLVVASRSSVIINQIEEAETFDAAVFPNPATNRIILQVKDGVPDEKSIVIYDVNGRTYPLKISRRISNTSVEIDISKMQKGYYHLRLKSTKGYKFIRFVKG